MNYELAKELKDAGFPQTAGNGGWVEDELKTMGDVYAPTLSELVEACGDGFGGLLKVFEKFQAMGGILEKSEHEGQGRYSICVLGATPEEAVARLWLALNKKP